MRAEPFSLQQVRAEGGVLLRLLGKYWRSGWFLPNKGRQETALKSTLNLQTLLLHWITYAIVQGVYCVDQGLCLMQVHSPRTLSTLEGLSCDRPMLKMGVVGRGQCVLIRPVADGVGCGQTTLGPGECRL